MANIFENRVSTTFTQEELDQLTVQQTEYMKFIKPKTLALTQPELESLSSMAVDNFVFVKEALEATDAEGAALIAASVATMVPELEKDVTFFNQLNAQEALLTDLLTRVQHTKRVVAHESYNVANAIYGQYQSLASIGTPGAVSRYNKLKERYEDNGGGRPAEPTQ